jgi:hypothetical protein
VTGRDRERWAWYGREKFIDNQQVRRRLVRGAAAVAAILAAPSRAVPDERRPLRSSAPRKLLQLLLQGAREPGFDLKPDAAGEDRNSVPSDF